MPVPKILGIIKEKSNQKIVFNTAWLFSEQILRMGVGLFIGIWVARHLGVEDFGILSYAGSFTAIFSIMAKLGLPSLIVREVTHKPEKKDQILGTAFFLQLLGGVFCLCLTVLTISALRQGDELIIVLVTILSASNILTPFATVDLWFQSQTESRYSVISRNCSFILTAIARILFIQLNAPLVVFATAILIEIGISAVGFISFYQKTGHSILKWRWNRAIASSLLRESWPLMLSGFTVMIYMKIDQLMIGQMLDARSVGLYAAAARISEVWYFIPTAISTSVAPKIYATKINSSKKDYKRKLENFLKILYLISIFISLPISLLSNPIISILFGSEYLAAGTILAIHIWASLFVFMLVGTSSWFIAEKLPHFALMRNSLGVIVNLGMNLLLIPMYGGVGAAISTVVSYAVAGFIAHSFFPRSREIFMIQIRAFKMIS